MARIIKFPIDSSVKLGFKKARRKKKIDLEEHGQLNLFTQSAKEARIVSISSRNNPFERAMKFDEEGDVKLAKEYYNQAIENGESLGDAFCNLGVIQSEETDFSNAIDSFTKCLEAEPRHFEAHYNLANVYSEVGNLKLAKIHYELCMAIEPEFVSSYYNLGLALAMDNNYTEAMKILSKYRKLTPETDHANVNKLIDSLQKTLMNKAQ